MADDEEYEDDDIEEESGDDGDAEEAAPAASKPDKKPLSRGQRLAAQKAAKAAQKAAKRGKQAELVESKVVKQAGVATEWAARNRQTLLLALGAVTVAIVGAFAYSAYTAGEAHAAASLLQQAVTTAEAPVETSRDGTDPDGDDERERYGSLEERAEKALGRYRQVLTEHPSSRAAVWARLGEGAALLAADRAEDARAAFETALRDAGDDDVVAWRALEGIAFSYEAEEQWAEATERLQELEHVGDGAFEDMADFHLARIQLAQGERDRAKETLRTLYDRLNEEDHPERPFLRDQVELRLMELDSSLVQRPASPFGPGGMPMPGGGGNPADQLSPEQLQRLIESMQKKAGGGAGGAGE